MDTPAVVNFADDSAVHAKTWRLSCYSSFAMLENLFTLARVKLEEYILDPQILKKKKHAIKEIIKDLDISQIEDLWASASGTCTIFAINVVKQLCSDRDDLVL